MLSILQRPLGYIFLVLVTILGGLFALSQLEVSMYPPIAKPTVRMTVSGIAMTPEEVYQTYAKDLKQAAESIEDALSHRIEIYSSWMRVKIEFDYSKDRDEAKEEVRLAFDGFKNSLPQEIQRYVRFGYDGQRQGLFATMISSRDNRSSKEIYELVTPEINHRLSKVRGIDSNSSGVNRVSEDELVIEFDEKKLVKFGIFLPSAISNIRSQTANISSGRIVSDRHSIYLKTVLERKSVEDFQNILLKTRNVSSGAISSVGVVKLKDVAKVYVEKKPPNNIWRSNGKNANFLSIKALPGSSLWSLSRDAKKLLSDVKALLPKDIEFRSYLDPSVWIGNSIRNMIISALIGTFIAVLVILLFLGDLRSTTLIAISIPTSIIGNFLLMKLFSININMISLGGMALAVGMIVDSSIVVLENIYRIRSQRNPSTFKETLQVIADATKEVKWPVIVSTLTSIIVFLPLSYTAAMANAILGDMSKVVVFTLALSVLAALVILPIFSRFTLAQSSKTGIFQKISKRWMKLIDLIFHSLYERMLHFFMRSKRRSLFFCIITFAVLSALVATTVSGLKKELLAEPDAMIFEISLYAKYVSAQEEVLKLVIPFEEKLKADKYQKQIKGFVSSVSEKNAEIRMLLNDDVDIQAFEELLEQDFESSSDFHVNINRWNPTSLPLPRIRDAKIKFNPSTGSDYEDAKTLCKEFQSKVRETEDGLFGRGWCQPWSDPRKEILIQPNHLKLQRFALSGNKSISARDISIYAKAASDKIFIGEKFIKGQLLRINARYPKEFLKNEEDLKNLAIYTEGKSGFLSYPLNTFADILINSAAPMTLVVDGVKNVEFTGRLKTANRELKKEGQDWIRKTISEIRKDFPKHKAVMIQENPYAEIEKSINSLVVSLVLSVILILAVLIFQFQSIAQPLITMLAIPLGVLGALLSLAIFKSSISLNSMLGMILLSGIAVNNSILIVDFFNSRKKTMDNVKEALISAVQVRFRPILMTMMTTILAMLPIALSWGTGGETLQPLGIAVSGGLVISTFFTLMVVPLVLFLTEEFKRR